MLAGVPQVEPVVEIGRILPLVVLEDRFELVERLDHLRLGGFGPVVFVPEGTDGCTEFRIEGVGECQDILALALVTIGVGVLVDGGDVAVDGLAEVVDAGRSKKSTRTALVPWMC